MPEFVAWFVRLLAGGCFVWIGLRGLVDPRPLHSWSERLPLPARRGAAAWLAATLPALEFVLGLCFALGVAPPLSGPILAALLLGGVLASRFARGAGARPLGPGPVPPDGPARLGVEVLLLVLLVLGTVSAGSGLPFAPLLVLLALVSALLLGASQYRLLRTRPRGAR